MYVSLITSESKRLIVKFLYISPSESYQFFLCLLSFFFFKLQLTHGLPLCTWDSTLLHR